MSSPAVQVGPQETLGADPGPTGSTPPQTRLQQRIARIYADHGGPKDTDTVPGPIVETEPNPQPGVESAVVEYHQAIATFKDVFPVASVDEWKIQKDGTWLCRQTGEVQDERP